MQNMGLWGHVSHLLYVYIYIYMYIHMCMWGCGALRNLLPTISLKRESSASDGKGLTSAHSLGHKLMSRLNQIPLSEAHTFMSSFSWPMSASLILQGAHSLLLKIKATFRDKKCGQKQASVLKVR